MHQCASVHPLALQAPVPQRMKQRWWLVIQELKGYKIENPKMSSKIVSADNAGEWHCGINAGAPQGTDQGGMNQQPVKDLQQQQL